jgi:hypothetical protein
MEDFKTLVMYEYKSKQPFIALNLLKVPLLSFIILQIFAPTALAQNEDYHHVVSAQSGVSLFSFFRGNLQGSSIDTTVRFSSGTARNVPQIQVAYDYGITKWFSVGGAVSFNKVNATLNDVTYQRTQNLGNLTLGVSRTTIGVRALFHYGNANRLDMYSGVRVGAGIWGVGINSSLADDKIEPILRSVGGNGLWRRILGRDLGVGWAAVQAQLIAFGLRGYVTENLGINGELSLGSPYFMSLGLNYRLSYRD